MEKMVTDPGIQKVLLICDSVYAAKADARTGGVGTEAQIISPEMYTKTDQNKFVALLKERGPDGEALVPKYYGARKYIDFTEPSRSSSAFDELLRWVFGKPLYETPPIGSPPDFLTESDSVARVPSALTLLFRRATDSVTQARPNATVAVTEYFDEFVRSLDSFRLTDWSEPFDQTIVASIDSLLPYRNQVVDLLLALASHAKNGEHDEAIHRFFENLMSYTAAIEAEPGHRHRWEVDHVEFLTHELFLCAIASMVKFQRFNSGNYLLETEYYQPNRRNGPGMEAYDSLLPSLRAIDHRNKRLGLRLLSPEGEILKSRCSTAGITWRDMLQADFLVFMHAELHGHRWWPATLLYVGRWPSPFEVFARSRSVRYFERLRVFLNIPGVEPLQALSESYV